MPKPIWLQQNGRPQKPGIAQCPGHAGTPKHGNEYAADNDAVRRRQRHGDGEGDADADCGNPGQHDGEQALGDGTRPVRRSIFGLEGKVTT